jgi:hypothetical protein
MADIELGEVVVVVVSFLQAHSLRLVISENNKI